VFAGVTNAEFICGKAEDVLPHLMWRLAGQEVIIVADPPRAGLRTFHPITPLLLLCLQFFVGLVLIKFFYLINLQKSIRIYGLILISINFL